MGFLPCREKHSLISNVDNNSNQQQHMKKTDEVFYFSMTDFQRGSTSELFNQSIHKRDNEVLISCHILSLCGPYWFSDFLGLYISTRNVGGWGR